MGKVIGCFGANSENASDEITSRAQALFVELKARGLLNDLYLKRYRIYQAGLWTRDITPEIQVYRKLLEVYDNEKLMAAGIKAITTPASPTPVVTSVASSSSVDMMPSPQAVPSVDVDSSGNATNAISDIAPSEDDDAVSYEEEMMPFQTPEEQIAKAEIKRDEILEETIIMPETNEDVVIVDSETTKTPEGKAVGKMSNAKKAGIAAVLAGLGIFGYYKMNN